MMHGVTDIDAGWETVEHDATDFVLQDVHKVGVVMKILLGSVNRGCQMAVEFRSELDHLVAALAFVNR